jgi:hypothetical protein
MVHICVKNSKQVERGAMDIFLEPKLHSYTFKIAFQMHVGTINARSKISRRFFES